MSENGEIYTTGKNFTLPLAVTALTNSTSVVAAMAVSCETAIHIILHIYQHPGS